MSSKNENAPKETAISFKGSQNFHLILTTKIRTFLEINKLYMFGICQVVAINSLLNIVRLLLW